MNDTKAQAALLRQAHRIVGSSSSSDECETPVGASSDSHESQEETTCLRSEPSKKRKPTYYVRKDEKVRLEQELKELLEKMRELEETQYVSARIELDKSIEMNALLSSSVEDNNMGLAGAQSMISAEMVSRFRNPLDHYIYMPSDLGLREHSLMTLRPIKVATGTRLIRERMRYLDIHQAHRHSECTVLKNGDYLITQFDVIPFGHADLRALFDNFIDLISNHQTNVSESSSTVSIRESEDSAKLVSKQRRMLTTVAPGVVIETNAAMFSTFVESPDGKTPSYGIGVMDYIDKDDLYAYDSSTRLRMDITGCVYVTQTSPNSSTEASGVDDGLSGTTMVRCSTIRLHSPEFPISKQNERLARASAEDWASVIPKILLERFGLY